MVPAYTSWRALQIAQHALRCLLSGDKPWLHIKCCQYKPSNSRYACLSTAGWSALRKARFVLLLSLTHLDEAAGQVPVGRHSSSHRRVHGGCIHEYSATHEAELRPPVRPQTQHGSTKAAHDCCHSSCQQRGVSAPWTYQLGRHTTSPIHKDSISEVPNVRWTTGSASAAQNTVPTLSRCWCCMLAA